MSFVCLIFAWNFIFVFMEHGFQNGPTSIWESILLATFFEGRFFLYILVVLCLILAPWLTFGSLLAPLGYLLVPFGFLLAHFWCPLAHFWCPWDHFCSPLRSMFTLSRFPGVCLIIWEFSIGILCKFVFV